MYVCLPDLHLYELEQTMETGTHFAASPDL